MSNDQKIPKKSLTEICTITDVFFERLLKVAGIIGLMLIAGRQIVELFISSANGLQIFFAGLACFAVVVGACVCISQTFGSTVEFTTALYSNRKPPVLVKLVATIASYGGLVAASITLGGYLTGEIETERLRNAECGESFERQDCL